MGYTKAQLQMVSDCVMHMLDNLNPGITKDEFWTKNILDTTDVTEIDMDNANSEVVNYCKENGSYAALPIFEEGAFVDRSERRYTHWKLLEICEDYFRIEFNHYPIIYIDEDYAHMYAMGDSVNMHHPCWFCMCRVVVKVKLLTAEEHIEVLSHHPDFADKSLADRYRNPETLRKLSDHLRTQYHVGGVIEEYEYYMPNALKKILKKGKYYTSSGECINGKWVRNLVEDNLTPAVNSGLQSILFCSAGPIIEMFVYVNYLLSKKSVASNTHRNITSIYVPGVTVSSSDVRKERHFGNIVTISEKKPKSVNAENIHRCYTTAVWQRRSHLRHLPSGKVVPVKSAVCRRHNSENLNAPQVVYTV